MISFLRWTGRAIFAVVVLALVAGAFVLARFEGWRKQALVALDAGSKIVRTTAGDIEYTERGSGPVVLICHGAPGGYDQALLLGDSLAKSGFRVIAPSRPGFLRTPLSTGLLFENQADALAALLDKLAVPRAAVLGFSTGAPVATHFALRHPDRTTALVLVSPLTTAYIRDPAKQPPLLSETALFALTGDIGSWLLDRQAKRQPREALTAVFTAQSDSAAPTPTALVDFVSRDPEQLAFFQALVGTLAPLSPRESGTRNDLLLARTLPPIAYDKLTVPTLIITGGADPSRPWVDAKVITTLLPTAHTLTVPDAGHLIWFGPQAAAAQKSINEFLKNPPLLPTPSPSPSPSPSTSPAPPAA